jgi:RNA polymerase sigma-70 factor, ECF subfamily
MSHLKAAPIMMAAGLLLLLATGVLFLLSKPESAVPGHFRQPTGLVGSNHQSSVANTSAEPPVTEDELAHESNLGQADKALLDFAVKLGTRASEFSREDVVQLRTLGFSDEQILEAEVVTALNNFATWLVSIARNTALQRLRSRKNVESLDESEHDEEGDFRPRQVRAWQDNPGQCYSKSEIRQFVETGILALPAKFRVVLMLRDIEQLLTDEVARQLGLSVPAVKTRLLRGRLMLREWLSPHFTASTRGAVQ